jgi:hypothetical protein
MNRDTCLRGCTLQGWWFSEWFGNATSSGNWIDHHVMIKIGVAPHLCWKTHDMMIYISSWFMTHCGWVVHIPLFIGFQPSSGDAGFRNHPQYDHDHLLLIFRFPKGKPQKTAHSWPSPDEVVRSYVTVIGICKTSWLNQNGPGLRIPTVFGGFKSHKKYLGEFSWIFLCSSILQGWNRLEHEHTYIYMYIYIWPHIYMNIWPDMAGTNQSTCGHLFWTISPISQSSKQAKVRSVAPWSVFPQENPHGTEALCGIFG